MARKKSGLAEAPSPVAVTSGRAGQAMDRLCEMAVSLCGADVAAILLSQNGVKRVVACANTPSRLRSYIWDSDQAPYRADETLILHDATLNQPIEALGQEFGLQRTGFFLRMPVEVAANYSLGLVVFGRAPTKAPDRSKRKLLDEVVALVRVEFASVARLLTDPKADVTVARTLDEIRRDVETAPGGAALLDDKLTVLAMSVPLAQWLGGSATGMTGMSYRDLTPSSVDAIGFLYRRALETRQSPPDFELAVGGGDRPLRVFQIIASPFSPLETRSYFLHVAVNDITGRTGQEDSLSDEIDRAAPAPKPVEPTLAFLLDTLVERRTIRARKSATYLTLRSWRQPVREYQIKALKALKQNIPPEFPEAIAREIAQEVRSIVGAAAFKAVVPMPCGHSRGSNCLSVQIARAVAAQLELPVVQAFSHQRRKGTSHPKENVKRPPLRLVRAFADPVLLVDDVATSGAHIEEALTLLRPGSGAVMAIAWIGGDSAGDE